MTTSLRLNIGYSILLLERSVIDLFGEINRCRFNEPGLLGMVKTEY